MSNVIPIKEADRLLDELEVLARSNHSNEEFSEQFLDRLRYLVQAKSAAVLTLLQPDRWIAITTCGEFSTAILDNFRMGFERDSNAEYLIGSDDSATWFAILLRSGDAVTGGLLLAFNSRLSNGALPALKSLTAAFGEILSIRQHMRLETAFGENWNKCYAINHQVASCASQRKAAIVLVNQLLPILSAARITLATQANGLSSQRVRILSVSGVSSIDFSSPTIKSLESIAQQASQQAQPIVRHAVLDGSLQAEADQRAMSDDGTFPNLIAMRFFDPSSQSLNEQDVIILEWSTRAEMLEATPALTHFLPSLCSTWQQQQRWLQIPSFIRSLTPWSPSSLAKRHKRNWMRPVVLAAILMTAVWLLMRPYPLILEADAVLEPSLRRAIHASVDGYIEELLVEDGQAVKKGQILVKLRSPVLDLQIEEAIGQVRAFAEKRNGLRVALNQLTSSSTEAAATQTRLSADISLLETQEKLIADKLEFLSNEKQKLTIESPIDGMVASRELRRELESRPLRRGDSLFGVVDLEGDWQLVIRVADRDTGYLLKHYGETKRPVAFVFDSIPEQQFHCDIAHISTIMENSVGRESCLPVFATVDKEIATKAHVGAKARVFFDCGRQPTWFVWCRPLVEAIQKRIWLFFDRGTQS